MQLCLLFVILSIAWLDKLRVKWDNSQNTTQKMRTREARGKGLKAAVQLSRFDPDLLDCRKIKALYLCKGRVVGLWCRHGLCRRPSLLPCLQCIATGLCFPGWVEIEVEKEEKRRKEEKAHTAVQHHCKKFSVHSQGKICNLFLVKTCKYSLESIY